MNIKYYYFIDKFNKKEIEKLSTQISLIYRNYHKKSDPKELEKIIDKILSDNQDKAEQYKSGKDKLFGFFVGQVMKESGGKANPQLVNEILKKKLK